MSWVSLLAPAFIVGVLLIMLAAPLGCLVVYKNMAFFSDALAHGALLGIALASLAHLPFWLGMLITAALLVVLLWFTTDKTLPNDALLAAFSATSMALGLIIITQTTKLRANIMAFLFGDILTISWQYVWIILPIITLCGLALWRIWYAQLRLIASADVAQAEGVSLGRQRLYFMLLMAVFTVIALQAVGALLVSSLLVLPALSSRLLSRSPRQMLLLCFVFSLLGLCAGLLLSVRFDVASGLAVVMILALWFFIVLLATKLYPALRQS